MFGIPDTTLPPVVVPGYAPRAPAPSGAPAHPGLPSGAAGAFLNVTQQFAQSPVAWQMVYQQGGPTADLLKAQTEAYEASHEPPPPEPSLALLAPLGGAVTLLPQQTVVAATESAILREVVVGALFSAGRLALTGLGFLGGLLVPMPAGDEPDVRRFKPVVPKTAPAPEETTLEEVVVTSPKVQVGKTSKIDYFADVIGDVDLVSSLTIDTETPWLGISPAPSKSPSRTKDPKTPSVSSPHLFAEPSRRTSSPSTKPSPPIWPGTLPSVFQPRSPMVSTTPSPLKTPKNPVISTPAALAGLTPAEGLGVPSPATQPKAQAKACKCKPCDKEEKKRRKECFVTLVKERADPTRDDPKRWRKIPCQ